MNCLTILARKSCRGDLVRIVRLVRTFSAKPDKPPGNTKKEKANQNLKPFIWTKSTDEILASVARLAPGKAMVR
jgi:hypothetical protein